MPPVRFDEPLLLWLLAAPALLLAVWFWQLARRRRDVRRLRASRTAPVAERHRFAGGLGFWLAVNVAAALAIVALARPQALLSVTQTAGVDFVVLQDGSTSMRVTDVEPDRWQRSVAWIRTFAEVLGWRRERVALALFAHRAAPQVRLTSDPNALFFFLDHLADEPPFRLRDDTSWNTNIEDGLAWGVRMIEKDEELYGPRLGARAFVVLSDGQSWSGEVARSLKLARDRNIRVYVIGVGTTGGGFIPQLPVGRYQEPEPPIHSVLDRRSLRAIARAGGGRYFELGVGARSRGRSPHPVLRAAVGPRRRPAEGVVQRSLLVLPARRRRRRGRGNAAPRGADPALVATGRCRGARGGDARIGRRSRESDRQRAQHREVRGLTGTRCAAARRARARNPSAQRTRRIVGVWSSASASTGAARSFRWANRGRVPPTGCRSWSGAPAAGNSFRATVPRTLPPMARMRSRSASSFTTMSQWVRAPSPIRRRRSAIERYRGRRALHSRSPGAIVVSPIS